MKKLAAFAILTILATACGGNDPLQGLGDPVQGTTIGLNLPVDQSLIATVTQFSSSNPFFGMTYNNIGASATVTAPAAGFVVSVDNSVNAGFYAVTIYHNARLSSQLRFLQIPSVRAGDYVNAGDVIGSIPSSGFGLTGLGLSVYVDGSNVPTCPLSYLSSTARSFYTSKFGGAFPCLN